MDSVLRGTAIFFFLLVVFRLAGKRALSEATTFDLVLLLIISETTQQALLGEDFSLVGGITLILTLVVLDAALAQVKMRFPLADKLLEDRPLVIVEDGRPFEERMRREHVDVDDVLEAARKLRGLERLEQVKYAVLERSGGISIIEKKKGDAPVAD
jgi:uncharacterized membrane protein YcaP (DUF421 family)